MTRIATVGYLNAQPLTSKLDRERYDLVEGHPSEIAALLASGEVDVALVPVAAALTDGDFRFVGDVCIGAEGPVHSVLLVAEVPPEQWTEVVLDGVSRTSRTLARLLLTDGPLAARVRDDLKIVEGGMGEGVERAGGTVAGLVIGDAARRVPAHLTERIDLAEAWHHWTGLPFVFAVWAGRPDLPAEVVLDLQAAGREGLASRAQDYSGADLDYVTRSIRYELDDRALIGLRRYAAIAHREGLVGSEDVHLYDPPQRRRARLDLDAVLDRAADGEPLGPDELEQLSTHARTSDLAAAANLRRLARVGAIDAVRWSLAREIVVTDVDIGGASPWKAPGAPGAVLLSPDDVAEAVREATDIDAGEVHLVGGLHPGVGVDGWCRWIAAARGASDARVRALSLDGLRHLAAVGDLPVESIVERLVAAGLDGLAEDAILTLDDGLRGAVTPSGLSARGWIGLAEIVHRAGLRFATGLEYGAGESDEQRIAHLLALRDVQARTAGFTAFRVTPLRPGRTVQPERATAQDHLRLVALARIAVDGIDHHEATWLDGARGLAQAALHAGADTLGAVRLPPRVERSDDRFENPRAQVGKKRQVDPWAAFAKEVVFNLKKSGFASNRAAPEPRSPRAVPTTPSQPSA